MNKELMHRVADHIDSMPDSFDLSRWAMPADDRDICDTVGCVAGWAVMLSDPLIRVAVVASNFNDKAADVLEDFEWKNAAMRYLDLDEADADTIFTSSEWWATQMHRFGFEPDDDRLWDKRYIALERVPAKAAAEILRGVADGFIILDGQPWFDDRDEDED